jgi:hypothetical protein
VPAERLEKSLLPRGSRGLHRGVLPGVRLGLFEETPLRALAGDAIPLAAGHLFEEAQNGKLLDQTARGTVGAAVKRSRLEHTMI